ncbi:hypothetical protein C4552_02860 [Candidatus Parcubacteria bacterium]|nr:MAG: hypothetical protein C4552_02860 [Candidatus Parcubacteria bacterium]
MKTIFITSFHLLISRNIIATDIIPRLLAAGHRIVVVVPDYKVSYFTDRFARQDVEIVGVVASRPTRTRRGLFCKRLARLMLATESIRIREEYLMYLGKPWWYRALYYGSQAIGRTKAAPRIVRWLDRVLGPRELFGDLLDRMRPDLVFATDILNENDIALMHDARRRGIPTIGMVRSWDNLTIHSLLRIFPDELLVWSERLRREAIELDGMPAERIRVVGIPHYDQYLKGLKIPREEFFRRINADPAKPLIFFAPIGDLYIRENDVDRYAMDILAELDANVIVRFPPADRVSGLEGFVPPPHMYFDRPGVTYDPNRVGDRDLTPEDDAMLVNGIWHANLVVTGPSTIAIEAALFDKPTIIANFHRTPKTGFEGVRPYGYIHFRAILESGGVARADTADEFRAWIRRYLADPTLDREGRRRIIREQYGSDPDGKASERVADALLEHIGIRTHA